MAKKQRFRDTKQNRETKENTTKRVEKPSIPFASNTCRAKAFLTDVFMLLLPIFYIVIYLVMGGLEEASHQKLLSWTYAMVPFLFILTLFMLKDEGRTPGLRAQGLKVIEFHTLAKPSLFSTIFRNTMFLLTLIVPLFWLFPFFKKNGETLHDLLSATCVIVDPNPPKNLVLKPN
jgi:uncharacterized RDD family membrane protein YckC